MALIVETNKRGKWGLFDQRGHGVNEGTSCTDFRGDSDVIVGGVPPAAEGKSGYVEIENGSHFYPSVYGLRWVLIEGV